MNKVWICRRTARELRLVIGRFLSSHETHPYYAPERGDRSNFLEINSKAAFLSGLLYSTGRVPNHRSELRRFTERCVLDIDKSIAERALRRHRWHELDLPAARRKC